MFGALAGILGGGGGLAGGPTTATQGPVTAGPVVVNVAGFGSKANGNASAATVPAGEGAGGSLDTLPGMPSGFSSPLTLAVGGLALVLIVAALARK